MGTIARSPRPSAQPAARNASDWRPAFTINEIRVLADGSKFICMRTIWEAARSPSHRQPCQYFRRADRLGFFDDLARHEGMKPHEVYEFVGPDPNDYVAHPQIAIDYAGWIDNRFKIAVGKAIREWAEEQIDPDLKVRRAIQAYVDRGFSEERAALRVEGIAVRNEFNRTLKEHGVAGKGYAMCTDAINIKVHGGTARELKLARNIAKNGSLRDGFDEFELSKQKFAESLAKKLVRDGRAHGNAQCASVCSKAGEAVQRACEFAGTL